MWDQRFAEPDWAYGTEPNDFLVEAAGALPPGGEVLVLAAGQGRNAVWLAGQGHRVTAVDSSAVGLERARVLAAERGVQIRTIHADLHTFDLGHAAWDGVVSVWCPLTSASRADLHRRVVQALRPGGALVIEAYRPEQLAFGTGGPREADRLVHPEDLAAELAALRLERLEAVEREVREGRYHHGISATVRAVARRDPERDAP